LGLISPQTVPGSQQFTGSEREINAVSEQRVATKPPAQSDAWTAGFSQNGFVPECPSEVSHASRLSSWIRHMAG